MTYIIRKGKHRVNRFITSFWIGQKTFHFKVRFSSEWKQTWPGLDKDDVSKLIGIGCLNFWNLIRFKAPHHYRSLRAGIDYNEANNTMDLYNYQYNNNIRSYVKLAELDFDTDYWITLGQTCNGKTLITFTNQKGDVIANLRGPHWNGVSFLLRPYYGGNNATNWDIPVLIQRL